MKCKKWVFTLGKVTLTRWRHQLHRPYRCPTEWHCGKDTQCRSKQSCWTPFSCKSLRRIWSARALHTTPFSVYFLDTVNHLTKISIQLICSDNTRWPIKRNTFEFNAMLKHAGNNEMWNKASLVVRSEQISCRVENHACFKFDISK